MEICPKCRSQEFIPVGIYLRDSPDALFTPIGACKNPACLHTWPIALNVSARHSFDD